MAAIAFVYLINDFRVYFFINGDWLANKVQTSGCYFAGILAVKLNVLDFRQFLLYNFFDFINVNHLDE